MRVFINPGHGGDDHGAIGFNLEESQVTRNIANYLRYYLNAANVTTRLFQSDEDYTVPNNAVLHRICNESNRFNADLFISIHCNALNGIAHGTETYYYSGAGKLYAAGIQNSIIREIPALTDRGIKYANFYVLVYTDCPAVLVETAFIDNYNDNRILASSAEKFAKAICRSIVGSC